MGPFTKLILMSGWIALAGAVSAAPAIFCGQPVWAFGSITDATSVTNRFLIENRGDSSLLISAVKSSCGCTTATWSEKQIAPGGSVPLTVVFDPTKREGSQHKTIHLLSNDRKTGELKLTISGRVSPQVVAMPSSIMFVARSDKIIERTLTLSYDRSVHIKAISTGSDAITVKSAASQSSKSHVLSVTIDPTHLSGRFRGELNIETDHPTVPMQRVPILGQIKK